MFLQLEHNVPDIYVEKSRDFQLICRIINIIANAMAEKADNLINNLDIDNIDEELLYPLVRKLGFTTHKYFPSNILKNIAENFPYLIRNKGTLNAVRDAVYTVISANQTVKILNIYYDSSDSKITITSDVSNKYLDYIEELLEFVVPIGVTWDYVQNVSSVESIETKVTVTSGIIRFRGIGDAISHIIQSNENIILGGSDLTARGVDWDKLGDYKTAWGGSSGKPGHEANKPDVFYSKVNIAKIITKQPPSNNEIDIDEKN